jgi:hypothetical protein
MVFNAMFAYLLGVGSHNNSTLQGSDMVGMIILTAGAAASAFFGPTGHVSTFTAKVSRYYLVQLLLISVSLCLVVLLAFQELLKLCTSDTGIAFCCTAVVLFVLLACRIRAFETKYPRFGGSGSTTPDKSNGAEPRQPHFNLVDPSIPSASGKLRSVGLSPCGYY